MSDKIGLLVAFLLLSVGVAGFYYFHDAASVLRVIFVLGGVAAAVAVLWTTSQGKRLFAFGKDSIAEAKRVVWPSRKETMQTTGVVVLFAVLMALFLWGVDATLMSIVNMLMGRTD